MPNTTTLTTRGVAKFEYRVGQEFTLLVFHYLQYNNVIFEHFGKGLNPPSSYALDYTNYV